MNQQENHEDDIQTKSLADLPVTAEQEAQVAGGHRPWTLHKAVDNPDLMP